MIDRCIMTQLGPVITTLRVLVAGCVIITTAGFAGDTAGISVIQTDDRLTVGISPDGSVGSVKLDGVDIPLSGRGGFFIKEVLPPKGEQYDHGHIVGKIVSSNGVIRLEGRTIDASLLLRATFTGGRFIDVKGEIEDTTGKDRAMMVIFLLPLNLRGWRWENTLLQGSNIEPGFSYPSAQGDKLYLGKKDDGFANEDPSVYPIAVNKLPLSAVTCKNAGLTLAYPLHEPRVFMIRAEERGYSITFSLGVTALTEKFPRRATFRFVLYPVDPQWGIRSALERYYGFFPELFIGKAKRHGNFGFFFLDKLTDRPEDFGFAFMENDFQWQNGEMNEKQSEVAHRLGIEVFHWRNPWVMHTPLDEPLKADTPPEECLATLKAWAAGERDADKRKGHTQDCGVTLQEQAKAALNSYLLDEHGKFIRGVYDENAKKPYWVFPMNMDPDLPVPNRYTISTEWQYRFISLWDKPGFRGPRAFAWDATDDFDSFRRLNFRNEHFRVVDVPLTFDPETGRLCQVKGFHDWEFAIRFSRKVREAGGMIMANTTIEHSMMFLGSCIDVFVRERKIEDNNEERLSVMRALAGKKPVSFIGHWQPRDETGLKKAFHKVLLFGIAPGAEGCSRNKEIENAERAVFKSRMPVFISMAGAGWEPVTYARADGLYVERFGTKPGSLFFAVRNAGTKKRTLSLQVDTKALGISGKTVIREVLEGRSLKKSDGQGYVECEIEAGETLVLFVMDGKE